jgi:hypothetical protein
VVVGAAPKVNVRVVAEAPAEAGTTDNRPKPIAATVASATRLKVVFVDICFLSKKVDLKDFFRSAGRRENAFSSDMSEPFLSVGITLWMCRWLE